MNKNILIIIVVVILAGGGYFVLKNKNNTAETDTPKSKAGQAIGTEIFSALTRLESLKLDESIFANPVYKNLKSFSRDISKKPVGKDNPFIEGSGGFTQSSVSTTVESSNATTTATTTNSIQ